MERRAAFGPRAVLIRKMAFALRPGISFCEIDGRLIFLDINRDRYFCLSAQAELSFRRLLAEPNTSDATLAHHSILVDAVTADPIRPTELPIQAVRSLLDGHNEPCGPLKVSQAIAGLVASAARLRRHPLNTNLCSALALRGDRGLLDESGLRAITAAFRRAGRLVSTHDRCLSQSLAVARAIYARDGVAQIVIGVGLAPFAAHCWVQVGDAVVNDYVDHVRSYTPILVL